MVAFWSFSPVLCQLLLILFRITVKIAQLVERSGEKPRRNTDAGSSPRCGKGCFSQSQLPVQTLLRCPCAIACINICPHVNNCSHTIVWTQDNTAHTDRIGMGSAALAAAVPYLSREGHLNSRQGTKKCDKRYLKKQNKIGAFFSTNQITNNEEIIPVLAAT